MIPGASAVVMALVLSGLPVHSFTYRGFPPHKPGPRRRFLEVDRESPHTLVFYESLYRLEALLRDALAVYGDRPAALAHELTKLHESVLRGRLSELIESLRQSKPKGEYVVVIAGVGFGLRFCDLAAVRMSELPIILLLLLVVALLARMDLIFYLVYVLAGTYALSRWWAGRGVERLARSQAFHRPSLCW